ncbi:MAG: SAM-dependent methyltransferase [Thermoplasmata archaeon]|nr:SAM-dependent methyltransferase [Thermoplasmata archaeon]
MGPDEPAPPEPPEELSTADLTVDPVLRRRLQGAADDDGFLPFDRFVEIALYDPGRGFYDRAATRLGRAGDFYTAAHVHGLFGATLAAHFREIWKSAGSPARFHLVEVGAGDGTLAADLRAALVRTVPESSDWEFLVVERSAALRGVVEAKLGPAGSGYLHWRFVPSLAAAGPVRGIVLANELLDAYPFRQFKKIPEGWAELGVTVPAKGALTNAMRRSGQVVFPPDLPTDALDGAVLEVSTTMEAWIRELSDHLVAGRAVLIDFGDQEDALLRRGRSGTLEAIRGHRPVDPLSRPGTADLSAWVNFTRVRRTAQRAGFHESFYGSLSEALVRWGIDDVRARLEPGTDSVDAVKLHLAMKSFLFGFDSFRVLELSPERVST